MSSLSQSVFTIFMPVIFLLMAGFFIGMALKTLLKKRPVVLATRWFFVVVCIGFLPSILNPFLFSRHDGAASMMTWLSPAMFVVILGFMWIQMKGYVVFAVSESYLRDTLLSSAASLGYTVEERMSSLRITETGHEIQVSVQGWVGTAQIKPRNRASTETVRAIVKAMAVRFETTPGKMNYIPSYFYLIVGVFLILCSVSMISLSSKLRETKPETTVNSHEAE